MAVPVAEAQDAEGAQPSASPTRFLRFFQALQHRDFRLLWIGQSVSLLGDQFYFVALAWLTLLLTGSAVALGGVLAVAAIPRGVLMLAGGAISDRFSPRRLMLSSDLLRAVLLTIQAILVLGGLVQLWQLYVLACVFGIVDAIFYPSSGAIVPMLVDGDSLPSANALGEISVRGSLFLGPAAAGILIALSGRTTGSGIAFAIDAGTFVVSALALFLMRGGVRPPAHAEEEAGRNGGLFGSITAGLRYAWHDPILRALLITIAGIDVTLNGVFGVGIPVLVRTHLGGSSAGYGTLVSAFGAGAVLGINIAGSIPSPRRKGWVVIGITAGFGAGVLLLPFLPTLPLAAIVIAAMAIGSGLANVIIGPWLQGRTDPAMMGRVMSMFMFASIGLTPLSYAAAGWLATLSITVLFLAGGTIVMATALFAALSRPVRTIS